MKKNKITIPGFQFSGVHCGIKDDARKKDLALIYSEDPKTLVDGVFTQNRVTAAPVKVCQKVVKRGLARLVVINSGVANACTGKRGMRDALATQKKAAKIFNLPQSQVLVSSTGKIGHFLPMEKIIKGIKKAKKELESGGFINASRGIMTTDQYPKYGVMTGFLGDKKYTLAVLAKGAGMLCPNMATMLAYVVTDLKFTWPVLRKIFRNAVECTLNRITVDGDTSTNDTVLILANGRAGNRPFSAGSLAGKKIEKDLVSLFDSMARKITLDGEGATKCCLVEVRGAKSHADARKIAYAVGNSPLVKTALFGCDPNWGRIVAAVGYSGAMVHQEKINIKIGPYTVFRRGTACRAPQHLLNQYMKKQNLEIKVDCGLGKGTFFIYMSDLTYDYIHLNAEYHT